MISTKYCEIGIGSSGRFSRWKCLALSLFWLNLISGPVLRAKMFSTVIPLERGYSPIPFISPYNIGKYQVEAGADKVCVEAFCKRVRQEFVRYGWKDDPCGGVEWKADLKTAKGHPLVYATFGTGNETTLFLGGVHADELSPIHLSFRFARYLMEHPKLYQDQGFRVVVAPLVNPDGFFLSKPLRTNMMVDVNRNFFTIDWYDRAVQSWRNKRKGLSRYFPGYFPNTEVETLFQVHLIDRFRPDKVFSVHAPLGFLDYDGPGDRKPRHLSRSERRARQFVYEVSKKTRNYRVVDYSFYPGSLGNYAGKERNLPTITLELETTSTTKVDEYWLKFLPGFVQSVHYPFQKNDQKINDNATEFFSAYDDIYLELNKTQS